MMGFLRGLDCGKNGETTVMIGNSGNKKAGAPFPARLIAVSLPPEKALISKTRLLSENRRKGRVVQAETLEAAGHVLLLTSLPEDEYSAEQVADCYRLRWQIELAFKRLKSLLHLDALRAKESEMTYVRFVVLYYSPGEDSARQAGEINNIAVYNALIFIIKLILK